MMLPMTDDLANLSHCPRQIFCEFFLDLVSQFVMQLFIIHSQIERLLLNGDEEEQIEKKGNRKKKEQRKRKRRKNKG